MGAPVVNSTHVLLNALADQNQLANGNGDVVGGDSIITNYDTFDAGGYGWLPTMTAQRMSANAPGNSDLAGTMLDQNNEFGPLDGSAAAASGKRLFYTHLYSSKGDALNAVAAVGTAGYGYIFWLFSQASVRTANCRGWCVGGSDTIPTLFAPTPTSFICVDAAFAGTEVQTGAGAPRLQHIDLTTTGNEFDPTQIVSAAFTYLDGTSYSGTISRFGYYDAYTVYGGEAGNPGTFLLIYNTTLGEYHYAMAVGDGEQYRARMAIEFGHRDLGDSEATYFEVYNGSLNFSTRPSSLTAPKVRPFHGPDNKLGLEEKLISGDVVRFVNYQISSGTPWHFRFAAAVGATVEFINCVIQNAGGTDDDCEIDSDVLLSGGLIDQCGKFTVNGAEVRNLTWTNPANGTCCLLTPSHNVHDVKFTTDSLADFAIEIDQEGTYDFDNLTFEGFTDELFVNLNSGTVTINVNGGDIPSYLTGAATVETPVLLGSGWMDGATYTAESGGGDGKRMIAVVVSNDNGEVPTGVTFGGVSMTKATDQVQDSIGLSLWYLLETGNSGVFSGSQTIAASYSDGPSNITYQAATYDHIKQESISEVGQDGNTSTGAGSMSVLDDWAHGQGTAPTFGISTGSARCLVVVVNHEDNGGSPGCSGVTYGGVSMTEQTSVTAGNNAAQMFTLDETGIQAAGDTTVSIQGTAGDTPWYGIASFENVDQTTPVRDKGTATGGGPSVTGLTINDGDVIVAQFGSTGGDNLTSWDDAIATPDSSFADNTGDDPSHGAYKAYSGGDTTSGTVSASGGDGTRTCFTTIILAPGGAPAGALSLELGILENGLALSAGHFSSVQDINWTDDATARDEVDRTAETVTVADHVASADGTATMAFDTTDETSGVDAQIVGAVFAPSIDEGSGPTVNIVASSTLELTGLVSGSEVRAYLGTVPSSAVELDGVESSGESFSFSHSEGGNDGYIMIHHPDYVTIKLDITYSTNDQSIPVQQIKDRVYKNPT